MPSGYEMDAAFYGLYCTYKAKDHCSRTRPFVVNNEPTYGPDGEEHLKNVGSYFSGLTALGWTWTLILTENTPDGADAILIRGRA